MSGLLELQYVAWVHSKIELSGQDLLSVSHFYKLRQDSCIPLSGYLFLTLESQQPDTRVSKKLYNRKEKRQKSIYVNLKTLLTEVCLLIFFKCFVSQIFTSFCWQVRKRSKACRAGLREADELVSINEQPCGTLSHAQAMDLIDSSPGILHIRVRRSEQQKYNTLVCQPTSLLCDGSRQKISKDKDSGLSQVFQTTIRLQKYLNTLGSTAANKILNSKVTK